ncbi:MAG: L,D-transpeptidase/peptidoglycan binding protein [Actinobacteria bacterium]|nr:L,D-transpeptidase/peptidoglycan binding protein [Actinomycetota bacterium]
MARGRHSKKRVGKGVKVALIAVCLLVLTGGGVTYGAYRYDLANLDRILPGIYIDGVDVSGMTRDEAIAAVSEHATAKLSLEIRVTAADLQWQTTPGQLGMSAEVETAVDQALSVTEVTDAAQRVWHRLRDEPLNVTIDLGYSTSLESVRTFVGQALDAVTVSPRNAALTVVDGKVVRRHAKLGRTLDSATSRQRILSALHDGATSIALPTWTVKPKVTDRTLGLTLIVRRDVHLLYVYDGLRVVKKYPVATAAAGYETPPGHWKVVDKQENPTWYNPEPNTWGAGLPLSIPPGPGDPLGTRALYLSTPGILIHGTYDVTSVGTNASHGCIRMLMPDIEELYPLVKIGTPVYII